MEKGTQFFKIAARSITVFLDDGTIDMDELNELMDLAMQDGKIDDDEKRVLGRIFDRVGEEEAASGVLERIGEIRKKHGI